MIQSAQAKRTASAELVADTPREPRPTRTPAEVRGSSAVISVGQASRLSNLFNQTGGTPVPRGADPLYWQREQYRRRQYRGTEPRLANLDAIVLRIVGPLEPTRRPTQEAIDDQWRAALVTVFGADRGGFFASRTKCDRLDHGKLFVDCVNPAILMELRPKMAALLAMLGGKAVKEVRLR